MAISSTPSITSPGIGSGLDVTGLVNSLMNAEAIPLKNLNQQKTTNQSKISAYGTVKSSLSQLQTSLKSLSDPLQIQSIKATSSDSSALSVTGSSTASPGNYNIAINKLAQSQKLVADGQTNLTSSIGTGVINFEFGTISNGTLTNGQYDNANFTGNGLGSKTVTIDQAHSSLSGIRDAINAAGIGVTASIVNDGSSTPYRLTLTNSQTGETQSMKISVSSNTGNLNNLLSNDPAGNQNLTETMAAQNAQLTVDGVSISRSSNTVSDVITGVTLNLLKTTAVTTTTTTNTNNQWGSNSGSGGYGNGNGNNNYNNTSTTTTTVANNLQVSVNRDTQTLSTNIKAFIDNYNKLNNSLKSLTTYDQTSHTGAALYGESSVRSIMSGLRGIITGALPTGSNGLTRLNQIGVEFQKDGTLTLNQSKLTDAINNNFDQFAGLLATNGVASDSGISFVSASSKTQTGNYSVNISQIATNGSLTGTTTLSSSHPITVDSSNNTLSVNLDGMISTIMVPIGSYSSASSLAAAIQSQINGVAAFSAAGSSVSYSVSGNTVSFKPASYGSGSQIQITDPDGNNTLLTALLGASPNSTNGVNTTGTINGATASGFGQTLTAAIGDASEGLKLKVNTGSTGNRGYLNYTRGFAYQLDQLTTSFLDNNGLIATRTNGITSANKTLDNKIMRLQDRLDMLKQQYTKQFNTLDQTMSQMNSTQSYLTQQLAGLAKSSSSGN